MVSWAVTKFCIHQWTHQFCLSDTCWKFHCCNSICRKTTDQLQYERWHGPQHNLRNINRQMDDETASEYEANRMETACESQVRCVNSRQSEVSDPALWLRRIQKPMNEISIKVFSCRHESWNWAKKTCVHLSLSEHDRVWCSKNFVSWVPDEYILQTIWSALAHWIPNFPHPVSNLDLQYLFAKAKTEGGVHTIHALWRDFQVLHV